jgi:hypothetical protein
MIIPDGGIEPCSFLPQPVNTKPKIKIIKTPTFDFDDLALRAESKTFLELKWQLSGAVITNLMSFKEMHVNRLAYIQI